MAAIKQAKDLNLIGRLKEVSRLHFRGMSSRIIAREMDMQESAVKRDILTITDRVKELDNVDEYLKDLVARTGEELTQLNEMRAETWKQLDYASEMTVVTDPFGNPIMDLDLATGASTGRPKQAPRSAGMVISATNTLIALGKQRSELLKLVGPKVDISVRLQIQSTIQARILEAISGVAPDLYRALHREIQIITESAGDEPLAISGGRGDYIDGEFTPSETE